MASDIEIGKPEGRTQYSDFALQRYEQHRQDRTAPSSAEFTMAVEGCPRNEGRCRLERGAARKEA